MSQPPMEMIYWQNWKVPTRRRVKISAPEILADPIEAQPDADPTHPPPPSADSTEGSKYT
jgi:hypothetical protein